MAQVTPTVFDPFFPLLYSAHMVTIFTYNYIVIPIITFLILLAASPDGHPHDLI